MEYLQTIPVDFWITLATIIATLVLGQLSKKYELVGKKKIPLQNLFIGLFVCLVQLLITKDFNTAVALSGILSGGIYDIGKSFIKIFEKEEE